ncbi:unnamed protein product [Urochloa decumbens]|uniref:RNase H type-1 domain-containing protein n=1 Tax=Urochloa decumbens TaxID=240449 RepID=A0ABC9GRA2_9POAL
MGKAAQEVADGKLAVETGSQDGDHIPDGDAGASGEEKGEPSTHKEVEEEFDFDPSEGALEEQPRWFAMARFYSSQSSKGLFDEMAKAWNADRALQVQGLENNRSIIEFESEQMYTYVINGGPWRHKGNALIVVPYDGLRRPSEVVIDAVNVWVRFYDVPIQLRTAAFSTVLARMGHFKWQCPEDEEEASGEEDEDDEEEAKKKRKFGEWMRKSPLKRGASRQLVVPAAPTKVNRALNFSGHQLAKLQAASSATHSNGGKRKHTGGVTSPGEKGETTERSPLKLPWKVSNELSKSVQQMLVSESDMRKKEPEARDRVSGLFSYAGSGGQSLSEVDLIQGRDKEVETVSIFDKLKAAKAAKAMLGMVKKGALKVLARARTWVSTRRRKETPTSEPWRATFIYGEPRVEDRHRTWEILQRLKTRSNDPWVVVGDFNEVLWQYEHFSETKRGERQMEAFRDTLDMCGLRDIGFAGIPWTYDNKKSGQRNVKVRLDRGVANQDWLDRFPDASVFHLTSPCSDHCPLLVSVLQEPQTQRVERQAYYEIMWEREASLDDCVKEAWEREHTAGDLGDINVALKGMMRSLKSWSSEKFGSIRKELERMRAALAQLQAMNQDEQAIKAAIREMNELLYREEMLWLQRSRVDWLREGDRNTKFFHQKATWRKRRNQISKLKDEDGNWPFSDQEISDALFQIGPIKAPGPDGFPARFFQRNWELMKEDVTEAVKRFFTTGKMPEGKTDAHALEGLWVCRRAPMISSLLFADDSLLFFRANSQQAIVVKEVLQSYCRATGQMINFDKCSILFNEKLGDIEKQEVQQQLNVHTVAFEAKYLGLPTPDGRQKVERFQAITERLIKCCNAGDERLPSRTTEDFIAWHYERSGIYSVKSAYKMKMALEATNMGRDQSTSASSLGRPVWREYWKIPIPHKVLNFGWRVSLDGLATQGNKKRRRFQVTGLCEICGMEEESMMHALVRCGHAHTLRQAMRKDWHLPDEEQWLSLTPENLIMKLTEVDTDTGARMLLLLMRMWHVRNGITHDSEKPCFESSIRFLRKYWLELCTIRQPGPMHDSKGKGQERVSLHTDRIKPPARQRENWEAPEAGWHKINVDGAFDLSTGAGAVGVIIRDEHGGVLLTAWKEVNGCTDAEELEALACKEGLSLAAEWTQGRSVLESDCSTLVPLFGDREGRRSRLKFILDEAVEAVHCLDVVSGSSEPPTVMRRLPIGDGVLLFT